MRVGATEMRSAPIFEGLGWACVLLASGCALPNENGAAGTVSATTGGGSGPASCLVASDCDAFDGPCVEGACINGECTTLPANDFSACDDELFCTTADA